MSRCERCNRTREQMTCHLDVYNDFDDEPGNLICDDCIEAECARVGGDRGCAMPTRPEGYYHCAPGTFD